MLVDVDSKLIGGVAHGLHLRRRRSL